MKLMSQLLSHCQGPINCSHSSGPLAMLVYPPLDGSLLLSEVVDFNAQNNPSIPAFIFTVDESSDDLVEITFFEFARAAHRVAHAVRPSRASFGGEVVALIALTDTILYQTIVIGILKAGLVPFPISPRISPQAVVQLLEKTSCHRLLTTTHSLSDFVNQIKSEVTSTTSSTKRFDLTVEDIPLFDDVYPRFGSETADHPFEPFPNPTARPMLTDVALYLHSSGSTGFPKAIVQTHMSLIHWSAMPCMDELRDCVPQLRTGAMVLPPFHTLGIYFQILAPLYALQTVSLFPITTSRNPQALPFTPTPANILDHTRRTKSNSLMVVPTLLQAWSHSKPAIEFLKSLELVSYSGGALPPALGDSLYKAGVRFYQVYGGTEFGAPGYMFPRKNDFDDGDWAWVRFGARSKLRWIPQGDQTYECQFLTTETHHLGVENLPDVRGYATSDVFLKHPTKEGLWKIVGRLDDVIVHSTGEKTVPGPMEDIVNSSPLITGSIIFGRAHNQTGVLVELRSGQDLDITDPVKLAEARNKIWPVVEQASQNVPAYSRVFKEMIIFTSPNKPMARAGKGTVMRKATLQKYEKEIEALYDIVEGSSKAIGSIKPPESWAAYDLEKWLVDQASDVHDGKDIAVDVDLFEQGYDSLSATFLRHRITGILRASPDASVQKIASKISQTIVYDSPTIRKLAHHLVHLFIDHPSINNVANDGKAKVEEMVQRYGVGLPGKTSLLTNGLKGRKAPKVVLLTGSTGSLGSYLLASLLLNDDVERVYAFNRASKGSTTVEERQLTAFRLQDLDTNILQSGKLVFVEGDASHDNLGLNQDVHTELQHSTTLIIHNAWKVDFNLSLASFESNIRATRHLIDFAQGGPKPSETRILFTSSIASAQSWDQSKGDFPEEVIDDAEISVGGGYGESKYVAEQLLLKSGLHVLSFRIGQMCGSVSNGAWAITEWFPILVKSSVSLGSFPRSQGLVSWIPIDLLSKIVLEIGLAKSDPPLALNLVHPRPVKWDSVIIPIRDAVAEEFDSTPLPIVSLQDWVSSLEGVAKTPTQEDVMNVPAIKLLEFFRRVAQADATNSFKEGAESGGITKFSTLKSQAASLTMKELPSIDPNHAKLWVKHWKSVNMFQRV